MEDFRTRAQALGKGGCGDRLYHEFLDVDVVVSVFAAIENVHHGHWHAEVRGAVDVSNMLVQRNALGLGCRLRSGEGHRQNRVGSELGLVVGTVGVDHGLVQIALGRGVAAQQQVTDGAIHMSNRIQHAFAQVAARIAVPQFQCLSRSCGRAGGGTGRTDLPTLEGDFGHNGRVPAGIHHLEGLNVCDVTHRGVLRIF